LITPSTVAVLIAPNEVGVCSTLILDATRSYYLDTTMTSVYIFSLSSVILNGSELYNASKAYSLVSSMYIASINITRLSLLSTSNTNPTVTLNITNMIENATYTFALQVGNTAALAMSSVPVFAVVRRRADVAAWAPSLTIAPSAGVVTRALGGTFRILLTPSTCSLPQIDASYTFPWTITCSNPSSPSAPSLSNASTYTSNTRDLIVPSGFFTAGVRYSISISVIVSAQSGQTPLYATSSVTPISSAVVASIVGGDRTRANDTSITIDASGSNDPDGAPIAAVTYVWSCVVGSAPFALALSLAVLTQAVLIIPAGMLAPSTTPYVLTVIATASIDVTRSSYASVSLTVVAASIVPRPLVVILAAPTSILSQNPLRLQASVISGSMTPLASLLYVWSLTSTSAGAKLP
jgi:hypothetical protein